MKMTLNHHLGTQRQQYLSFCWPNFDQKYVSGINKNTNMNNKKKKKKNIEKSKGTLISQTLKFEENKVLLVFNFCSGAFSSDSVDHVKSQNLKN